MTVRVEGLKELRAELRKVDMHKGLQKAGKKVAEKVAERTRSAASGLGGVTVREVPTIKALASQTRAQVKVGGSPWSMGSLFGSVRYRQFRPWRGSGPGAGYYLWPQLAEMRDEITDTYADEIERLLARAFPD